MKNNLKTTLCNKLVDEGRVQEGDVIRHSYSNNRLEHGDKNMGRIENHEGLSPTLDTRCDCLGIVVDEKPKIIGSYLPNSFCAGQIVDSEGIAPTFLENHGSVMGVIEKSDTKRYKNYVTWKNKKGEFNTECNRASMEDTDLALTIATNDQVKVARESGGSTKLKIRKLTPKECIRLMGFTDEDYEAMRSIGMSDSAIYHMAGDSIIVTVLMAIFSQLINSTDNHIQVIQQYIKENIIEEKPKKGVQYGTNKRSKKNFSTREERHCYG